MLTLCAIVLLAPLAGLGTLLDQSVPFAITSLGNVTTMLLLVPAALTVINLVQTMQGRWTLLFGSGAVPFAAISLAFLLGASLLDAIGSLRSVRLLIDGTDWERGAFLWAAYGAFTFAAFALAEHALPRILRRAWGGGVLSGAQLWLAFGGATVAGLALMGGGMAEGSLLAQGTAPDALGEQLLIYRATAFLGFGMVALAGLAFVVNLFLMYTSGDPVEYTVPASGSTSATAAAGH